MRVLVTGGTGLIGSHLVHRLVDSGDEVHVVSRTPRATKRVTGWQEDLTHPGTALRLIREVAPDAVCHLAGFVSGARTLEAVLPTLHANLIATVELLDAVTKVGCQRLVVAGSLLEEPTEQLGGVPGSPYGASRWASSAYSRMYHMLFETPVVVLRPSYAYGPWQGDTTKLVPHVIRSFLEDLSPRLSSGERELDWLYAGDAADAFQSALRADGVEGTVIDIVSGDRRSVRDVVEEIRRAVAPPTARPLFGDVATRPYEQEVRGDPTAAGLLLGWTPGTELTAGLQQTIAWFRSGCPDSPGLSG